MSDMTNIADTKSLRKHIRFASEPGQWFDTCSMAVRRFKKMCEQNGIRYTAQSRVFHRYGDIPITWYTVRADDLNTIRLLMPPMPRKYKIIIEDEYYKIFEEQAAKRRAEMFNK